jgi:hypothetical protein
VRCWHWSRVIAGSTIRHHGLGMSLLGCALGCAASRVRTAMSIRIIPLPSCIEHHQNPLANITANHHSPLKQLVINCAAASFCACCRFLRIGSPASHRLPQFRHVMIIRFLPIMPVKKLQPRFAACISVEPHPGQFIAPLRVNLAVSTSTRFLSSAQYGHRISP